MKTLLRALLPAAAFSVGAAGSTAATFPTCLGEPATKIGTPGDDTITATDDDDVIVGLGGNDTIAGGGGFDLICGGDGNDSILHASGGLLWPANRPADRRAGTIPAGRATLCATAYSGAPAAGKGAPTGA